LEDHASDDGCINAFLSIIHFVQTSSNTEPVDYCLAPIFVVNVLDVLSVLDIIKPDPGVHVGEQQALKGTHEKSS
jgi:hypothetical protein